MKLILIFIKHKQNLSNFKSNSYIFFLRGTNNNVPLHDNISIKIKDGKVCCISLTRAEELTDMVRATLGPVMSEILK